MKKVLESKIKIKKQNKKQVALIVLDGWGYRKESKDNAIAQAKHPFFDSLWKTCPHGLLQASGLSVGLPEGQMGNSEVGHTTIGAGTTLDTDLVRISKAANGGEFENNSAFSGLFKHIKKHNSVLHVVGLIGPGGIHSHSDHLIAFLFAAKKAGISKVAIHAFTDGRDTPPQSAEKYLKELEKNIGKIGVGFIATLSGRFYAMDRDNNWDRLEKAEAAIFSGESEEVVENRKPSEVLKDLYKKGALDEHIKPLVFLDKGARYKLGKNDGIFFFNFRADRARMLSQKISKRIKKDNLFFVTMTEYEKGMPAKVAFSPVTIETTIAEEVSKAGLKQAHIAETEKFPHATYFLNGGKEKPHKGERHILLPSRKDVSTHDLAPKMQAEGIALEAVKEINKGTDFIFINFANTDMVGHTANVSAIIEAVEEVDKSLKMVIEALSPRGGVAFITADHGNAEVNVDKKTKAKHTAHTTNPVPAILTGVSGVALEQTGTLSDIAPTILEIFKIKKPKPMTGRSLLRKV